MTNGKNSFKFKVQSLEKIIRGKSEEQRKKRHSRPASKCGINSSGNPRFEGKSIEQRAQRIER